MGTLELYVEKLVPGGLGLARHEGEVILLPEVLPGETVTAELSERRRGVRRGRVVAVLNPSDDRAAPDCPLAGRCGGCDFIHARPEVALDLKSRAALGDLAAAAGQELELLESPIRERYRSRVTLHLAPGDKGRIALGFMAPGVSPHSGGGLVEFDDCRLLAPELSELVPPLRAWASTLPPDTPPFDLSLMKDVNGSGRMICFSPTPRPTGKGGLSSAAAVRRKSGLRGSDRRRKPGARSREQAGISLDGRMPGFISALESLSRILEDNGLQELGLFVRTKPGGPPRKIGSTGPDRLTAAFWPQWDLSLKVAPGGFTQVNPEVNRLMVKKILALTAGLKKSGASVRALDLYSGLGNIALPLAKSGFAVTAVEQAPESGAAARENAGGLSGFNFITGRSEQAAAELARQGRIFDLIVLDPPRSGAPDLAPTLAALKPRLIVYLACHPAVLPRDLPALASLGFQLRSLTALDMFPRTSHLEALALLVRD